MNEVLPQPSTINAEQAEVSARQAVEHVASLAAATDAGQKVEYHDNFTVVDKRHEPGRSELFPTAQEAQSASTQETEGRHAKPDLNYIVPQPSDASELLTEFGAPTNTVSPAEKRAARAKKLAYVENSADLLKRMDGERFERNESNPNLDVKALKQQWADEDAATAPGRHRPENVTPVTQEADTSNDTDTVVKNEYVGRRRRDENEPAASQQVQPLGTEDGAKKSLIERVQDLTWKTGESDDPTPVEKTGKLGRAARLGKRLVGLVRRQNAAATEVTSTAAAEELADQVTTATTETSTPDEAQPDEVKDGDVVDTLGGIFENQNSNEDEPENEPEADDADQTPAVDPTSPTAYTEDHANALNARLAREGAARRAGAQK